MEEWKLGRWKGETMERDNGSNGKEKQWKGDSGSMEVEKDWVTRNGHGTMEARERDSGSRENGNESRGKGKMEARKAGRGASKLDREWTVDSNIVPVDDN